MPEKQIVDDLPSAHAVDQLEEWTGGDWTNLQQARTLTRQEMAKLKTLLGCRDRESEGSIAARFGQDVDRMRFFQMLCKDAAHACGGGSGLVLIQSLQGG